MKAALIALCLIVEECAPLSTNRGVQTNAHGKWLITSPIRFIEPLNPAFDRVHDMIRHNETVPHDVHLYTLARNVDVISLQHRAAGLLDGATGDRHT
jgi:hypothetical protein